jgi:hypothetical protein
MCLGMCGEPGVVSAAFEAGINFFFLTADMHWPLYEQLRRGLCDLLASRPSVRDDIVVGVVSYVTQPEFSSAPFLEAIDAVPGLGHLDVAIAGGAYGHELGRRLDIYAGHRANGFAGTRAIGASFHDRTAIVPALEARHVDIGFLRYNPVHPGAAKDVFPHVRDDHPLLYNFKSTVGHMTEAEHLAAGVGNDYWRPHQTDYYRFALTQPALDGILCALDTPDQVGELADALAKGPLDEEDHQYLLDLGELARGTATIKEPVTSRS